MRNTFFVTAQIIDKNGYVHILDGGLIYVN